MKSSENRLIDLTSPKENWIPGMTASEARERVESGDPERIGGIPGHFALAARDGITVRMARTIGVPLRYFVAKRLDGPFLVVGHTIRQIWGYCREQGIAWQFDPSYTRMVPAHYLVEIDQVGCPDPNPRLRPFFAPETEGGPPDVETLGARYLGEVYNGLRTWLEEVPPEESIGVAFSGGVDSTSVLALARHALKELKRDPGRLLPITLEVEEGGADGEQAGRVLEEIGLGGKGVTFRVPAEEIDLPGAVETIEDYRPLDVQCAAAMIALLGAARKDHPELRHILDGDGSDENLRAYPLEDSDLTLSSALKNPLLYLDGWGVDAIKHSLTYSGGLSRSHLRTWAPAKRFGFKALSPYTLRSAVREAMAVPVPKLVGDDPSRLYALKGEILRAGVRAVTGVTIPNMPKRRFQEGVVRSDRFASLLACTKEECRVAFRRGWDERIAKATAPRVRART